MARNDRPIYLLPRAQLGGQRRGCQFPSQRNSADPSHAGWICVGCGIERIVTWKLPFCFGGLDLWLVSEREGRRSAILLKCLRRFWDRVACTWQTFGLNENLMMDMFTCRGKWKHVADGLGVVKWTKGLPFITPKPFFQELQPISVFF